MPPAVARLKSEGGSASGSSTSPARAVAASARLRLSTSSSSTMWRGALPSSRSWMVTPHVEWMGRHVPVGSTSVGVHGPAATSTASAVDRRPIGEQRPGGPTVTLQRPRRTADDDDRAAILGQRRPGGGGSVRGHREPRLQADRGGTGRQRRLEPLELIRLDQPRFQLGERRRHAPGLGRGRVGVAVEEQQARRLVADREPGPGDAGEGAVPREALDVERGQDRVEWVLDRPEVAAGGTGTDRRPLDEDDGRATVGHDRRRGAADDAAADDDHVGTRRSGRGIGPASFHGGRIVGGGFVDCGDRRRVARSRDGSRIERMEVHHTDELSRRADRQPDREHRAQHGPVAGRLDRGRPRVGPGEARAAGRDAQGRPRHGPRQREPHRHQGARGGGRRRARRRRAGRQPLRRQRTPACDLPTRR